MNKYSFAYGRDNASEFERFYHAASLTGFDSASPMPVQQSWLPFEGFVATGFGSGVPTFEVPDGTHAQNFPLFGIGKGAHSVVASGVFTSAAQSARDQIRFIQASLGLTVAQLASALGVERQTIYTWLQAEQPPALQVRTRTRLSRLTDIARQWNQRCPRPAEKLATTLDLGGATLLELLSQAQIDELVLQAAMDALAAHIRGSREQRSARLLTKIPPHESAEDRILRSASGIRFDTQPPSQD